MASKKKSTTDFSSDRPPKSIGDAFYGLQLDEEQLTFANAIWNPDIDIVFVDAKAGTKKIASIKYSDVKKFYIHLIKDVGFKPNSLEGIILTKSGCGYLIK